MILEEYFEDYNSVLKECLDREDNRNGLDKAIEFVKKTSETGNKIILMGNGGSAAIAEHMAIDFTKNAGLRATTLSGTPQLTTLANDRGYENVYAEGLKAYADEGDVVFLISSSGNSQNMINAACQATKMRCVVITLSGFDANNALKKLGDVNLYVNSRAYGYVELIHNLLIHYINDAVIGKAIYSA